MTVYAITPFEHAPYVSVHDKVRELEFSFATFVNTLRTLVVLVVVFMTRRSPPLPLRRIILLITQIMRILIANLKHHGIVRELTMPRPSTDERRLVVVPVPRALLGAALHRFQVVVLCVLVVLREFFGHEEAAVVGRGTPEVADR